jgi:hypothetical protein
VLLLDDHLPIIEHDPVAPDALATFWAPPCSPLCTPEESTATYAWALWSPIPPHVLHHVLRDADEKRTVFSLTIKLGQQHARMGVTIAPVPLHATRFDLAALSWEARWLVSIATLTEKLMQCQQLLLNPDNVRVVRGRHLDLFWATQRELSRALETCRSTPLLLTTETASLLGLAHLLDQPSP